MSLIRSRKSWPTGIRSNNRIESDIYQCVVESFFKVVSTSDETSIVKLTGDKIVMKPGIMLESKPRTGGLFESLRDSMK